MYSCVGTWVSVIAVESRRATSFNLTNNDTNIIGPRVFFFFECRDAVFFGSYFLELVLRERETIGYKSFFAIGTFRRFIIGSFSDHRHDPRRGVVFHSFVVLVCLLLVSWHGQRCVTHFECEDGAARRDLA